MHEGGSVFAANEWPKAEACDNGRSPAYRTLPGAIVENEQDTVLDVDNQADQDRADAGTYLNALAKAPASGLKISPFRRWIGRCGTKIESQASCRLYRLSSKVMKIDTAGFTSRRASMMAPLEKPSMFELREAVSYCARCS
ncbi:hypothetical protein KFL_002690080 [Klebsormidium nitens]|uniref:Uncharacterized protein n=1 Tax=Klebsormidium nitens TaxID=105231 RepID=A0A1Y1I807_KLENI|nr:hypothetical protein KFL_002690080 [Klebsormidium nitens]|eukprot:GAQ86082.1 hypothetical protein KFL_002690080 [Klebsormidium nitens]